MVILHFIWMFLKLSKGKGRVEGNIVCNFVNMVRVNWVIHLVKNFCTLLSPQIFQFKIIKNEGLEVARTPPNLFPSSLRKHPNKII